MISRRRTFVVDVENYEGGNDYGDDDIMIMMKMVMICLT